MWDIFQQHSSAVSEMMYWKWANEHPYLFTAIKVSQPTLVAVLLVIGARVIGRLFAGRK